MKVAVPYTSMHRIRFSDLDPNDHVSTANYATYFVDHRMEALRDTVGWDLKTLRDLPFMVFVRRLEIDFLRPARGDQEVSITSFVRDFRGPDAHIECIMVDGTGKSVARCQMIVAHVDRETRRATDWPPEQVALFYEKESA